VIILEGNDGKGWVDCRIQLCRLKTYFDKQRVVRQPVEGQEGNALVGQKGEVPTGKVVLGLQGIQKRELYAEVVMRKKTIEGSIPAKVMEGKSSSVNALVGQKGEVPTGKVVLGLQGIQKRELYAEVVMGKKTIEGSIPAKVMEGKSSLVAGELTTGDQIAGEEEIRSIMERAKDKASLFAPGDRVIPITEMHSASAWEQNFQSLKEILISLKREIDSCMHKIEKGCITWGKSMQRGFQKDGSKVADGLNQIQPKFQPKMDPVEKIAQPINRFKKIYRRRRGPKRLLRWRVKEGGQENQMMPEKLPESSWSREGCYLEEGS
jgi:hypothetical protein